MADLGKKFKEAHLRTAESMISASKQNYKSFARYILIGSSAAIALILSLYREMLIQGINDINFDIPLWIFTISLLFSGAYILVLSKAQVALATGSLLSNYALENAESVEAIKENFFPPDVIRMLNDPELETHINEGFPNQKLTELILKDQNKAAQKSKRLNVVSSAFLYISSILFSAGIILSIYQITEFTI